MGQAAGALAVFIEAQLASGAWPIAMKLPAGRELGALVAARNRH